MTARSSQPAQRPDPAQRFLTDLDRKLGPSSAPLTNWPATVLFWISQMQRLTAMLSDGGWRESKLKRQGTAR